MMRLVRISLALALALLIATPVMAQPGGGGKGGGRGRGGPGAGGMFGMGTAMIQRALDRMTTLSDDEKTDTKKILDEAAPGIEKLQKAAAFTAEQRKEMQEAMAKVKESGKTGDEARKAMQEAMQSIKRTDDQDKAQKELTAKMKELQTKIADALKGDNKEAFKKAMERRPGGPGAGKDAKAGERPKRQRGEGKKKPE